MGPATAENNPLYCRYGVQFLIRPIAVNPKRWIVMPCVPA